MVWLDADKQKQNFSKVEFVESALILGFFDEKGCLITTLHFAKRYDAIMFKKNVDMFGSKCLNNYYNNIDELIKMWIK